VCFELRGQLRGEAGRREGAAAAAAG
jgi:hypothetical protein